MPSILGANTLSSGFNVDNSLRFNDGDSPALTRSLGTTTLATKGTFSFWVKRGQLTTAQMIYTNEVADDNNRGQILFEDDDTFMIRDTVSGSNTTLYATAQLFKDVGAWYHMVVALDSTEAGGNRIRVYKNGTRIPDAQFGTSTEPNQNSDFKLLTGGQTNKNHIGKVHGGANHFDGYLAEFVYCDGQVLDASSFGEFDSDSEIWKPKSVSGLTFGDQGFYLDFEDSSALGNDAAGSNNFGTVTNLAATDQSTDTCTNNFATMNSLDNYYAGGTFAEGNLQVTTRNTGYSYNTATIGVATGKWYWEVKWSAQDTGSTNQVVIGIAKRTVQSTAVWLGSVAWTYSYQGSDGKIKLSDSDVITYDTYAVGDIIGVALDLDNNRLYFSKNGTFQNSSNPANGTNPISITAPDSTSGDSGFYFPAFGDGNNNLVETGQFNFGSPIHSISSGNADADGHGNFEYAVPSGYYALNTKNLAEYG